MDSLVNPDAAKANRAWSLVQSVRAAQARICTDFLEIGRLLAEARDQKLYRAWAEHTNTFDAFLEDLGLRRTSAYNSIRVWEQFGNRDVQGIPMDRLVTLAELKLGEEEKDLWIEKARELPSRGLRDEARERKGLPTTDTCQHDELLVLHKCLSCGQFIGNIAQD